MKIKTIRELIECEKSRHIFEELESNGKIIDDPVKSKEWFKKSFLDSLNKKWVAVNDVEKELYKIKNEVMRKCKQAETYCKAIELIDVVRRELDS